MSAAAPCNFAATSLAALLLMHMRSARFMKYKKMKKVADGKRRNSEGKFIKKADLEKMRLAEEAVQRAAEEVPSIEIPLCHQILVQ